MTLLRSLLRILFQGGSPERILYSRHLFLATLGAAIVASALAQWLAHHDHLVFVILRVFAELTMFMLWMVFLTAKVARLRLANMGLVLLMISVLVDVVTILAATALEAKVVSVVVGLVVFYGVANVVAWAMRKPIQIGAIHFALYLAAVSGLEFAFRHFFSIVAGS